MIARTPPRRRAHRPHGELRERLGNYVSVRPLQVGNYLSADNMLIHVEQRVSELRFLLRDRDTKFTVAFDAAFASELIKVIKTPPQAPRANAVAERWVGSVRRECTDTMLIVGERHLAAVLDEYTRHFNGHRPHRTLDQRSPVGPRHEVADPANTRIIRRPILGRLINEYSQAA